MSKTIEAIRGLLNLPRLQAFYAEAQLEDGRTVVTEADAMEVGAEVRVMGEDGNAVELPDGTYTLADGVAIVIEENKIAQVGGDEAPTPEEMPEEMSKHDEMKAVLAELGMDESVTEKVMAAITALYENEEEKMAEAVEVEKETTKETEEKLSSVMREFASEVEGVMNHILDRLERLESEPASEPVKFNALPVNSNISAPGINANYTERARYIMNSLKTQN